MATAFEIKKTEDESSVFGVLNDCGLQI